MSKGTAVPEAFNDVVLCDRIGVNWFELQELPIAVVELYQLYMRAEAMARKWAEFKAK